MLYFVIYVKKWRMVGFEKKRVEEREENKERMIKNVMK